MFRVHIALTDEQIETIVDLGPYTLRRDGVIESRDGVSLTNCRPNRAASSCVFGVIAYGPGVAASPSAIVALSRAVECEWDRSLVALLNAIAACKGGGG